MVMSDSPTRTDPPTVLPPRAIPPPSFSETGDGSLPRWISIALGGWLVITAFAWPQTDASLSNAVIVGALLVALGVVSLMRPVVRWATAALAVWLFASNYVLPQPSGAMMWNQLLVALGVLLAAFVPSRDVRENAAPTEMLPR